MKNEKEINFFIKEKIIDGKKNKNYYSIIDIYITFIKNKLNINNDELAYILSLTLNNKYNKIFYSKKDYFKNIDLFEKNFKNMFMLQYINNCKYLKIKSYEFDDFIKLLNERKKRLFVYFEKINKQNKSLFETIINYSN